MERYREAFPGRFPGRASARDVMDVFELTRALVDIDSVTPNEEAVSVYLFDHLARDASVGYMHGQTMEAGMKWYDWVAGALFAVFVTVWAFI